MTTSDTPIDIVRNFTTALEGNDFDVAAGYLTDNFLFSGWTPRPLTKANFLSTIQNLKAGIPGLIFNLHNVLEENEGRQVTATWQVAGYQSDSFILPALGTPPIPQMARSVSLPTEDVRYLLENGQINALHVQSTAGGGIVGLLNQLDFDLPIVQ